MATPHMLALAEILPTVCRWMKIIFVEWEPNMMLRRDRYMKRLLTPLAFVLILAACGSTTEVGTGSDDGLEDGDVTEEISNDEISDAIDEPIPVEPDGGIGDGAGPLPLADPTGDTIITNSSIVDPRATVPTEILLNPDDDTELWVRFVGGDPNCTAASGTVLTETPEIVEIELLVGITEDALARSCQAGEFNLRVNVALNEGAAGKSITFVDTGAVPEAPELVTPEISTEDFIGLTELEAAALVEENQLDARTVRIDDEFFAVTQDLIPSRLNFEFDDGVITVVTFG